MTAPCLFPTLRYRDADAAIAWLTDVAGFREHMVHRDDQGVVVHAQLSLGSSILMLGQERDDAYGARIGGPTSRRTDTIYVAVTEIDTLAERIAAAGASIETGLHDTDYGSREFSCRDPEGNLWSFGTYWPVVGAATP